MKQQRANHDHKASYSLGNDSKVSLVVDVPLLNQGDHWSLFAYWVIVYSGQFFFFENFRIWATFFLGEDEY
jgi:hypothetical protein